MPLQHLWLQAFLSLRSISSASRACSSSSFTKLAHRSIKNCVFFLERNQLCFESLLFRRFSFKRGLSIRLTVSFSLLYLREVDLAFVRHLSHSSSSSLTRLRYSEILSLLRSFDPACAVLAAFLAIFSSSLS